MFFTRDHQIGPRSPRAVPVPGGYAPLVLHLDMDAFFASVEMRSDPRLKGRSLVVGGGPEGRGVVTTASYPAREFGIHSGMSLAEARRRCANLLVLPVDPAKMIHESLRVLQAVERVCPRVEPASIDEAYLEFSPVRQAEWRREARRLAREVQAAVESSCGLPCSVGAAVSKLSAKMASSSAKPSGVLALSPSDFLGRFAEHSVRAIPGIGPKTTAELERAGISTIGELASTAPEALRARFGSGAEALRAHAHGNDATAVLASGEEPFPGSAGHETTLARESADPIFLRATLCLLADRVARRLRRMQVTSGTVSVRFKVGLARFSRQRCLVEPTDDAVTLTRVAWSLLESARGGRALRLVGVAGMDLRAATHEQPLFLEDRHRRTLQAAGDRLRDRFGEGAIVPGETLRRGGRRGS